MTFPLSRAAPLHASQIRRPERTSQRERPRHPPPIIFSETAKTRAVQQISTTDRIHIRHLLDGRVCAALRFSAEDVELLEGAIRFARTEPKAKNVGRVPLFNDPDCWIDVGGGRGHIFLRRIIRGVWRDFKLVGDEVDALERAVEHFKMNAASAAV